MKLTILLCSLFFAAIAAKDSAPEIERGSSTVAIPSPKNCDALTDRKTCKKKDQKKVTSNPTLTSSPNPNLSDPNL